MHLNIMEKWKSRSFIENVRVKSSKEITRWINRTYSLIWFLKIRSSKYEIRNKYEWHKSQIQNMQKSCKYCISSQNVFVIWYSNFDIVSHFDIRISDLNPVIGRVNPPDLTKLESTFDVTVENAFAIDCRWLKG